MAQVKSKITPPLMWTTAHFSIPKSIYIYFLNLSIISLHFFISVGLCANTFRSSIYNICDTILSLNLILLLLFNFDSFFLN